MTVNRMCNPLEPCPDSGQGGGDIAKTTIIT